MDIQELWDHARKDTEIVRMRLQDLSTFETTAVPYIFLAESSVNRGDTVIRRGQVLLDRPAIFLPNFSPQFEGFQFDEEWSMSEGMISTFLLVRGIHFPSLRYRHELSALDLMEQPLQDAIRQIQDGLNRAEDISTGLVIGPEESWQFSVLFLVGALVVRSAEGDLRRIVDAWRKRQSG